MGNLIASFAETKAFISTGKGRDQGIARWYGLGCGSPVPLSSPQRAHFIWTGKAVRTSMVPANPVLLLTLQKLVLVLYWVPVSFAWICLKRISYAAQDFIL